MHRGHLHPYIADCRGTRIPPHEPPQPSGRIPSRCDECKMR
jgi:hypothetical protein